MRKLILMAIMVSGLMACSKSEASLAGKTYALLPEKNITITFDDKEMRFYGQAVNNYFGDYKLNDGKITLTLTGSTMMAAPVPEMEKEREYFQNLGKIKTYELNQQTLKLKGDDMTLQYEEINH